MRNSADYSMFFLWKFCPLDDVREILPPSQNLLKSRFPDKIFDNSVFLISSRAQTSFVRTNSTRRIFLDRSQGFLTSFLGVTGKWKSYFENYKKKSGARHPASGSQSASRIRIWIPDLVNRYLRKKFVLRNCPRLWSTQKKKKENFRILKKKAGFLSAVGGVLHRRAGPT